MVYEAGWLQDGIVAPAQLGTAGYLFETPDDKWYSEYWQLIWDGAIDEARAFWKANSIRSGLGQGGRWTTQLSGPARVLHPLGRGVQARGLGDRAADRRVPVLATAAGRLPEEAREQIRAAYESGGFAKDLVTT